MELVCDMSGDAWLLGMRPRCTARLTWLGSRYIRKPGSNGDALGRPNTCVAGALALPLVVAAATGDVGDDDESAPAVFAVAAAVAAETETFCKL